VTGSVTTCSALEPGAALASSWPREEGDPAMTEPVDWNQKIIDEFRANEGTAAASSRERRWLPPHHDRCQERRRHTTR